MKGQDSASPLSRANGLGSAKSGVEQWWAERASAVALVPLTLWFVACLIGHVGGDYASFRTWLRTPEAMIPMVLLLLFLFHHAALGLQVIIEDYVHSRAKFAAALAVQLSCIALAAAGIVAALETALSS